MKILFDHQAFSMQVYGGISRYFIEIIKNFPTEIQTEISVKYSNNHYLNELYPNKTNSFFPKYNFKGKKILANKINNFYSSKDIKKSDYSIFHPTYYDPYFLNNIGKKPYIVTIHDMVHEKFPNVFSPFDKSAEWKRKIASKASAIIAVSENTKKDIIEMYNIHPEKITVIYHGFFNVPDIKISIENLNINFNYIIYIGSRNRYKNFVSWLMAIADILKNKTDLHIICVGGDKFTQQEISLFEDLKLKKRLHQFSVDDKMLSKLLNNALAFVFPSKYEGFGIPILEAFANECAVMCSNKSSLPEVAGDASEYFDPYQPESMQSAFNNLVFDEKYRYELIQKGKIQLENFSWKKTAEQTVNIYTKF